jgi:choline-sulfatase
LVAGSETTPRVALGETDYPLRFGWAPLRSIRRDNFKFIEAPRPELYDLRSDPGEVRNRYEPWDAIVQTAREDLAGATAKPGLQPKPSPGAVAANTISELHALGYLGAADARSSTNVPEPSLLPDPKDKIEEQNLLHAAMMASEDGQVTKAKSVLEKLLQQNGDSVLALSQLGELEMASGNFEKARDYLRHAHELRPDEAKVNMNYARTLRLTKDFVAARSVLEQSLKADPKQPEARILLAQIQFRLDSRAEAKDQLASAVLSEPGNTKIIREVAKTLIDEREFEQALELLEPATESSSDRDMLQLLAQAYRGLGRMRDARRAELQATGRKKSRPN